MFNLRKFITFCLFFNLNLFSNQFFTNSSDAFKYAKLNNKIVFSIIISRTCKYCKIQEYRIRRNKKLANLLENEFVTLYLDISKSKVPKYINFNGSTPTITVLTKNKAILSQMRGLVDDEALFYHLKTIINEYANKISQIDDIKDKLNKNNKIHSASLKSLGINNKELPLSYDIF